MASNVNFDWENMSAEQRGKYFKTVAPDCSFLVGSSPEDTRVVKSYKAILSSASPVFDRMFNGDFAESRETKEIKITDAEPDDFQSFVDRIAKCKHHFGLCFWEDPQTTFNIFYLSIKYEVEEMQVEFRKRLSRFPFASYPCNALVQSFGFAVQIEDEELVPKLKEIIVWKAKQNPKPRWGGVIYDLDEAAFYEWFCCVYKDYTPIERFNFVEIYAKIKRLERNPFEEGILEKMLEMVDFGEIDAATFRDGLAYSKILTIKEKKSFLKHHNVRTLYMSNN